MIQTVVAAGEAENIARFFGPYVGYSIGPVHTEFGQKDGYDNFAAKQGWLYHELLLGTQASKVFPGAVSFPAAFSDGQISILSNSDRVHFQLVSKIAGRPNRYMIELECHEHCQIFAFATLIEP